MVLLGLPAQLPAYLGSVDRVAQVMPRPVPDKSNLVPVASAVRARPQFIQMGAQQLHQFQIRFFVIAAYIVRFPGFPGRNDGEQRFTMVQHIQPVPHVLPLAVHGDGLPGQAFRITTGISFSGNW